jgi:transposase-like protein
MPPPNRNPHRTKPEGADRAPSWDALHAVAESQQGVFTAEQAAEAGFSSQLLNKHLHSGNLERARRGIYRLARFPAAQRVQEDLVVAWLWSGREGVLSHETALQLHELSDALPAHIHLTVPASWSSRRVQAPELVRLYHADLSPSERAWVGSVPVTTPGRTIVDVAAAHGDAALIDAAIRQALRRNLASLPELAPAVAYLAGGAGPPGPGRVRPEAVADLDGRWLTEALSGTCAARPPPDWRVEAEHLARRHGARLRAAELYPDTGTLFLELVWPLSSHPRPEGRAIREDAARVFGWR